MKAEKKVLANLNKCYAVSQLSYDGKRHLICAAEKEDPAYVFDLDGTKVDTLWEGPGGVMTLAQYPLSRDDDPILMATYKFYSPNNSAEAKIAYYTRENGAWVMHVLCDLPFVHRFGLVERGGVWYIVACTLKSAHAFKDDWTCPGRIWVGRLPEDIRAYSADHQLELTPLVSGLYKNHGFVKCTGKDGDFVLVGTENGVYRVTPPAEENGEWDAKQILDTPASDMLYQDYDNDGAMELLVLSPFHGDTLTIYKETAGGFKPVYTHEKKMPFLHAIWGANIEGTEYAFIGNRQEDRELLAIHYDNGYVIDVLDQGAGPANCMYYKDGDSHRLLAANRETDEIAVYTLSL